MSGICSAYDLGNRSYSHVWNLQRALVTQVQADELGPVLLLVEHPPVFTIGRGGNLGNLLATRQQLAAMGAEFHRVDRGGDVTFHGPGQLVVYPIMKLPGLRHAGWYVRTLEQVVIDTLSNFNIAAFRRPQRPGVWIDEGRKVCALGVRISRGVTSHGLALNVTTDLGWFRHIVPCGLSDARAASLQEVLGEGTPAMREIQDCLVRHLAEHFDFAVSHADPGELDSITTDALMDTAAHMPAVRGAYGVEVAA
jgi:lipoyl(octanoyl) transferase